jgi:hypothetical protein
MIIIFEPQCRGFEHEQFNAGFLYGYSLAYSNDKIVFFAEKNHIDCVKNVFTSANLSLKKIQFVDIEIPAINSLAKFRVIFAYYRMLKKLLCYAYENRCNRIVFLSIFAFNLIPLKILLQFKNNNLFQVHMVMHGTLEFVKKKNGLIPTIFITNAINRLKKYVGLSYEKVNPTNKYFYEILFKKSLYFLNNKNITYYVFRDDSLRKLTNYLPKIDSCFKSIDLPYIFKGLSWKNEIKPSNRKVFATIGNRDVSVVKEVVRKLNSDISISVSNYEIRVIGSGNIIRQDDLETIKYIGRGQRLTRVEIEEQLKDVQYILFFYDSDSYELTTSGSFFDAIAYVKPLIFLKNHCFDYYYQDYKFGYRCEDVNGMIASIKDIIINNDENQLEYISEITRMQKHTSIRNNYYKLNFNEGINHEY